MKVEDQIVVDETPQESEEERAEKEKFQLGQFIKVTIRLYYKE